MEKLEVFHSAIILDACCAINLYASGKMAEIILSVPCNFFIASYVKQREVRTIAKTSNKGSEKDIIDLQPFIDNQLLDVVELQEGLESIDAVNFAYASLDDGEAITGAIAKSHNWGIATDDKKGIEVFKRSIPHIQVITTPELIKHWHEVNCNNIEELRAVLNNIRYKGRYQPSQAHSLFNWWSRNS